MTGCASTPMQFVTLEPLLIEAVVIDGVKRVEVLDPELLFEQAGQAFQSSDYGTAAQKYGLIVSRFGKSRWANVSRYNGGLALERSGRCTEAVVLYDALVERVAGSRDAQDALFRVACCN
jgi:TolA-binding protein